MTRQERRANERQEKKRQERLQYVVTVVPPMFEGLAEDFLPPTPYPILRGLDGTHYYLHIVTGRIGQQEYTDLDGQPLSAYRSFPTLTEANAWVSRDSAQRAALSTAQGIPQ